MFGLFAKLTKIPLSHPETSLTTMCISCLWGDWDGYMETTDHPSHPDRLKFFWNDWDDPDNLNDHMETRLKKSHLSGAISLHSSDIQCITFTKCGKYALCDMSLLYNNHLFLRHTWVTLHQLHNNLLTGNFFQTRTNQGTSKPSSNSSLGLSTGHL